MDTLTVRPTHLEIDVSELAEVIRERHRSLLRELRIEVVNEGVVLHGHAYSFYGKQVALHELLSRDVPVIANRIAVGR